MIILTFDDGPHPDTTPHILDLLTKHQTTATFFITGQHAEQHTDILKRIRDENHEIGCHSYHHHWPNQPHNYQQEHQQLLHLLAANNITPQWHRYPHGHQPNDTRHSLCSIGWTTDTEDWKPTTTPQHITQTIEHTIKTGTTHILLLHDNIHETNHGNHKTLQALQHTLQAWTPHITSLSQYQNLTNTPPCTTPHSHTTTTCKHASGGICW